MYGSGRASVRAATPDRLPIAGAIAPGLVAPGLYVLGGLGSRGFTLAPLLGEHVAALALGAPSPLPAALALGMFDELARLGLHEGDPRERELLWAACMLHDIGMSIDYDDHHKHSRYLILNGSLPGFAPVETAIIAQAARYHRKGMPAPMEALFGPGDAERLERCATLLRLAEDLERSRDQLVRSTTLALHNGTVEMRLIADGESAVPRWAVGRERELFARAFHRELSVAA